MPGADLIAILPAAGRGTRMLSVTNGEPKELLPIGETTVMDWVSAEAETVTKELILIWRDEKGKLDRPFLTRVQIDKPGLAPAIASAFENGEDSRPSLVLLPDTIFHPESPVAKMAEKLSEYDIVVATETVRDDQVGSYGIVELGPTGALEKILEKPKRSETESRVAVSARYAFSSRFIDFLRLKVDQYLETLKEMGISELINLAIAEGMSATTVALSAGTLRLDCGSPEGYAHACEVVGRP